MPVDSLVGRPGGVSYMHIPARDRAASAAFYRAVFGWPIAGTPDAPSFSDGTGHVIGRWVTDQAAAGADGVRPYIYVTSVAETITAITAHGGHVVTPPYPEGTLRVALFADPAGNVLGIWEETAGSPL